MKKLLAGVLSLVLVWTCVVVPEVNSVTAQAAETTTTQEYSLELQMTDVDGFNELSTGNEVSATGKFKTPDGTVVDSEKWEYYTDAEMEAALSGQNIPLSFYSVYDNAEKALSDMVAFSGPVPVEAFGKFVYKWFGAYLISDPTVCKTTLVRSDHWMTDWADTDYCTFTLNNDKKSVYVYSIWSCDSANLLSKVSVGGETYKVTAIGDYALENAGRKAITSVTIPSTITTIGIDAFADAINLKTITIEGNLNTVGKGAFSGINGEAVFKIKASKSNYNKIVKKLRNSGVPKSVKFKRIEQGAKSDHR